MRVRLSLFVYTAALVGIDAMAIAALRQPMVRDHVMPVAEGRTAAQGANAQDGRPAGKSDQVLGRALGQASDDGWALCLDHFDGAEVTPATVAVTYLDPVVDDHVMPTDIESWFGSIEPRAVDVYKLVQRNGRRRISFEIQRGKWPEWERAAGGLSGRDMCSAVRGALLSAGVGRPQLDAATRARNQAMTTDEHPFAVLDDSGAAASGAGQANEDVVDERSRYDFEFIYARRPRLYRSIEWVGPLDHALEDDTFVEMRQWLNRSWR